MAEQTKTSENILGRLLLPAYTDAGANTTFRPIVEDSADAATEIHDNRTGTKSQLDQLRTHTGAIFDVPHTPKEETDVDGTDSSLKFNHPGFFPSTNPVASNRQPQESPRPTSPPVVTRRQMPAPSVAGASTIPDVGGENIISPLSSYQPTMGTVSSKSEVLSEVAPTTASSGVLGHKFLDEVDNEFVAENGIIMTSSSDQQQQYTYSKNDNKQEKINSFSISPESVDGQSPKESEVKSDDDSDVNSTSSEMGTVINAGGARMAEVEAMAKLAENNPYDEMDQTKTGLTFPILKTLPYEKMTLADAAALPNRLMLPQIQSTSEKESEIEGSTGNAALPIMSAAIRRMGSGLNKKSEPRKVLSAPATPSQLNDSQPPRIEELLKSTLSPNSHLHDLPTPSQALLSPGAGVLQDSTTDNLPSRILTPRFSRPIKHHPGQSIHATPRRSLPMRSSYDGGKLTTNKILPGPFRFAQKCFSFDSNLHEQQDGSAGLEKVHELPILNSPDRPGPLRHSLSWDAAGMNLPSRDSKIKEVNERFRTGIARAFRTNPRNASPFLQESKEAFQEQRERLHSDFSPCKKSAMPLQTPQRLEIEREDALDILSCLVERGIALNQESSSGNKATIINGKPKLARATTGDSIETRIATVVEDFRLISEHFEGLDEKNECQTNHESRMVILDELVRCHSYALEMERAAVSASTWLRSIGRASGDIGQYKPNVTDIPEPSVGAQAAGEEHKSEEIMASEKVELLAMKAMLRSAQNEAREKIEFAKKLNAELSQCRAEIGRLRSAPRALPGRISPNRSILDDHDSQSVATTPFVDGKGDQDCLSPIQQQRSEEEEATRATLFHGMSSPESKERIREADQLDIIIMQSALDQANAKIKELHKELTNATDTDGTPAPVVEIPEVMKSRDQSPPSDKQTVNVRMLDGENFVTEWDELTPPLPPPPDHGLRSPIVNTVLEQWTTDHTLHESLLDWMQRVMAGDDLETVPPLTISSLDHQVRDGFLMHVLPLLLRRADIHIAVQTRAHRRTTYDIAVAVARKDHTGRIPMNHSNNNNDMPISEMIQTRTSDWSGGFGSEEDRVSVSHSSVTAHVTNVRNSSPSTFPSETNGDGRINNYPDFYNGGPYVPNDFHHDLNDAMQQQHGIMSALGGALGGLLSRKKYSASSPARYYDNATQMPAALRAQLDLTSSPIPSSYRGIGDDSQPYHRVVSAPPGRIGVTFVEFRGHAMVSDVAPDSPLSGWVFESDILIAIDEVPVSGMRVRDIIKLLTNRRERQRALRVISSHAMNEFTNASHLSDPS